MNTFFIWFVINGAGAKKIFILLILVVLQWLNAFSQAPMAPDQEDSTSTLITIDSIQNATPVVIIDDDELGITVSPNPASTYINIQSKQNLDNKTIIIVNDLGIVAIKQNLSSATVVISSLGAGIYVWIITNSQNNRLAEGTLIVQ